MIVWATLPPLISLPLSLILVAFGSEMHKVSAGAPLWVLLLLLYFALTMMYVFSIKNGLYTQMTPLQMATQGIMICIVSMEAGAPPILPWVGVVIAVSGFFMIIHFFMHRQTPRSSAAEQALVSADTAGGAGTSPETTPFPLVVTDDEGVIVQANASFKDLTGDALAEGKSVMTFFTPGETEGVVGGKKHAVFQKAKDGLFHFLLIDNPPPVKSTKVQETSSGTDLFDPKTGLYSRKYAQLRIKEELSRANRYRRWLCGILLKVNCAYLPGLGKQPTLEDTFLVAYVQYIKNTIRESDMGFFMGEREILLLLPETPQQGAKDTALKLIDLPEPLLEMTKDYPFATEIEYGFLYYSGNYPLVYDQFIQKLYSSLGGSTE